MQDKQVRCHAVSRAANHIRAILRGQASLTSPVPSSMTPGMMAPPPDLARRQRPSTYAPQQQQQQYGDWAPPHSQWHPRPPAQYQSYPTPAQHTAHLPPPAAPTMHSLPPGVAAPPHAPRSPGLVPAARGPMMGHRAGHPMAESGPMPHQQPQHQQYAPSVSTGPPAAHSPPSSQPLPQPPGMQQGIPSDSQPAAAAAEARTQAVPVDCPAAPAGFNVVEAILGPGNSYLVHIERETGAMIALHGHPAQQGSAEPLGARVARAALEARRRRGPRAQPAADGARGG